MLKTLRPRRYRWLITTLAILITAQFFSAASFSQADQHAAAKDPAAGSEAAQPTEPAPEQTIEFFHAGLLDIMKHAKELGFEGRTDRLTPLMERCFDLDFMASKTVGRHWNKLSDEDKLRWTTIFARFTTANYAGRFTGYTGEQFVTLGIEDAPRDTRMVMTKIIIPKEDDVELNYRMAKIDGVWKIVDVFLNGTVSELALRRSEYSSALKRNGFEQLVTSVETQIAKLKDKGQADG